MKTTKNNARGLKSAKIFRIKKRNRKIVPKSWNSTFQKEETKADLLANWIKRKVENLPKQLKIMCETDLRHYLSSTCRHIKMTAGYWMPHIQI